MVGTFSQGLKEATKRASLRGDTPLLYGSSAYELL
jgi:hypothetical protein